MYYLNRFRYAGRVSFMLFLLNFSYNVFGQNIEPSKTNQIAKSVQEARENRIEFKDFELFTPVSGQLSIRTADVVKQSTVAELDSRKMETLLALKPNGISISVPFLNSSIQIELIKQNILTEDFEVYTSESPNKPISYKQGVFYRGIIQGDENSVVGLSFFDGVLYGMISSSTLGNVTINQVEKGNNYLIYSDKDLTVINPFSCAAQEPEGYAEEVRNTLRDQLESRASKCVKVYLETDYALYVNKGYSTTNVTNYITAVFNNLATLYANEQITTQISQIYIWTTQDSYSKTSSSTALTQFKSARPSYNGNIAHLAALGGNNLGGVAWVNALCSNYGYAYSNITSTYNNVPVYSWTVEVMTHEMGHNLGSPHTQSCTWQGGALDNCYTPEGNCNPGPPPTNGGTIMSYCHLTSYGINFNNGFGSQPGNLVRAKVSAATCLGTCDNGSCNSPSGLAVTNIQNTTATVSWNAVSGSTGYEVQYRQSGGSWTLLPATTYTTLNLTGLTVGKTYEVQVRTKCASGTSAWSPSVSFTMGSSCGTVNGLTASNITSTTATASWNALSGAISYDLEYKVSTSNTWYLFNTTGTGVNFTGLAPGTTYNLRVRANCASGSGAYSAIVNFTTQSSGDQSYCNSRGYTADYEWIDLVRINTINNPSGSNAGYGNFTNLSTNVTKGTTYSLTISAGLTSNYIEYWNVWIDYNRDGDFNDTGENPIHFSSNSSGNIVNSITIPTTASVGTTRMRVSMKYGGYATNCQAFPYGEVEDYTLNIVSSFRLPSNNELSIEDVSIYPNPITDLVTVTFQSTGDGRVDLNVMNIDGKTVQSAQYDIQEGLNSIPMGMSDIAPGLYVIEIKDGHSRKYVKIVKAPTH